MGYTDFTYDGDSCFDHDIVMCSFDSGEKAATGGKAEIVTVKPPNSDRFIKTNANYKEPLVLNFQICKNPCVGQQQNELIISPADQVEIKRWLERKEYHYLSFDGLDDVYYNAQLKLTEIKFGENIIGYDVEATCDAPYGWSDLRVVNLCNDDNPNDSVLSIFDDSDEIGSIIPDLEITVLNDGDVGVYNDATLRNTIIKHCIAGEIITITDGKRIKSNIDHKYLYDDFNWVFQKITNSYRTNVNNFELTNCKVKITWRETRKAVI